MAAKDLSASGGALNLVTQLTAQLHHLNTMMLTPDAQKTLATCAELAAALQLALTEGSAPEPTFSTAVAATAKLTAAPVVAAQAEPKQILIIDDDDDMQKTLRFLLPKKGAFQVHSLLDPRQAMAFLRANKVQVVLMDLMMPHLTGFELLAQIRAEPAFQGLKIIVGSSRSYDKDRITVLKVGADEFIAKPYNFSELSLRLKHLAG